MGSNPIGTLEMSPFLILAPLENCSLKLFVLYNWDFFWLCCPTDLLLRSTQGLTEEFQQVYERKARIGPLMTLIYRCFRSVVVITSASHAEGRRFEPGRKQFFFTSLLDFCSIVYDCISPFVYELFDGISGL